MTHTDTSAMIAALQDHSGHLQTTDAIAEILEAMNQRLAECERRTVELGLRHSPFKKLYPVAGRTGQSTTGSSSTNRALKQKRGCLRKATS